MQVVLDRDATKAELESLERDRARLRTEKQSLEQQFAHISEAAGFEKQREEHKLGKELALANLELKNLQDKLDRVGVLRHPLEERLTDQYIFSPNDPLYRSLFLSLYLSFLPFLFRLPSTRAAPLNWSRRCSHRQARHHKP